MKPLTLLLALSATAAIVVGCGPSGQRSGSIGYLPQTRHAAGAPSRRGSWMHPDAKSEDLLYVSNGNSEVTVYEYWRHNLVGVLTSFTEPKGICVDGKQNVYVADYGAEQIVEYAHGGTKAIAKFDDSPDTPYSCWIDPTTGNLAVANYDSRQSGNIAIWANGIRQTYSDPQIGGFEFCTFDANGTLLATNGYATYPYNAYFAWLPKGGTKLIDISVPGPGDYWTWGYLYGLEWDGRYFVLDGGQRLFRESLIHGQAFYAGYVDIGESDWYASGPHGFYTPPGATAATQIAGGMTSEGSRAPQVAFWKYPAGGTSPITTLKHGLESPFGVAVSLKI